MNITLFGANGAIGKIVLNHALAHGDSVTAYVRRVDSLAGLACKVNVIVGDLSRARDNSYIKQMPIIFNQARAY